MEWDEYQASRKFAEAKMLALMDHENKPHAAVAFPADSYLEYNKNGRKFFYFGTNIFRGFFEDNLPKAIRMFPLNFSNGNAMSVIHAVNKTRPVFIRDKEVVRILQNECLQLYMKIE
ncbi:MAG: hypothetical protein HY252_00965 [Sphingobacteriales bacterium]|nr:hypothetical protein [Sphingobacteriales bacterium]